MMKAPPFRQTAAAFTLVELLAVITIMAILMAVSIPVVGSLVNSYELNAASRSIMGQLNYARQDALANNQAVQVRFYKVANTAGTPVYRVVQSFRETTDSSGVAKLTAITKPYFLPKSLWIVYDSTVTTPSTLFTTAASGAGTSTGDTLNPLPAPYGVSPYVYFRFRPNGRTDLLVSSLLTVAVEKAAIVANGLPANFVTLQIDSVNGSVRFYQP